MEITKPAKILPNATLIPYLVRNSNEGVDDNLLLGIWSTYDTDYILDKTNNKWNSTHTYMVVYK